MRFKALKCSLFRLLINLAQLLTENLISGLVAVIKYINEPICCWYKFISFNSACGRRRDPPVRGAGYEPFDSILFRIEVRKAKKSQSDAVRTKLRRCVVVKDAVQSFHPCDNTLPNSHNWPTKKTNDKSTSVRNRKILLVEESIQVMSLRLWLQVAEGVMTRRLRWYTRTSLLTSTVPLSVSDGKILGRIVDPGDEPRVCDYKWPKE